ncbi:MAG TPA: IS1634 family transposase [Rectinema sp.]|jgi:transposase|nr:IS1634 family transposase [Rectinema sp.]
MTILWYNPYKEPGVAFVHSKNKLKSGDVVYYIFDVHRIPGSNKQKRTCVERYRKSELMASNVEPEAFIQKRIAELKAQGPQEITLDYRIELRLTNRPSEVAQDGSFRPSHGYKNLGYLVYACIYHQLKLDELINNRRRYTDASFNINIIFQHLIYSRCLMPSSKLKSWEVREMFFGSTGYALQHIYRSLDYLLQWRADLLTHLDYQMQEKYGRKHSILYYDVTNYYFEIDDEDALRKRGVSKEHRPDPIVQMGLFMDEHGLPVTYELFAGNTADVLTLRPAMEQAIIDFTNMKRIIVADKGMMSVLNILKIRQQQNGYVMSQSVRKSDEATKAYVLSEEGYTEFFDAEGALRYKLKERTIPRMVSATGQLDTARHSGIYNERQVVVYSPRYAKRAREEREYALKKAALYVGTKSTDARDSTYGKLKYVKKTPLKNGEKQDADAYLVEWDKDKLAEDEKYDGYYLICTNVIGTTHILHDKEPDFAYYRNDGFLVLNRTVSAQDIAHIYSGLWRIEETFKVTKTGMLKLRPVFHQREDRIKAHFLLCFVCLVLERVLEYTMDWKYSAASIQYSLSHLNGQQLPNSNVYLFSYYDQIIRDIEKTFNIDLSRKFLRQIDIRMLLAQTKKIS